ncbi:hypothetical protein [Fuerstiella marisgermanici]|uniref:Uncharacterized protein n=1 Tax=Fuerstiella marisgermanici TaxID=1891926 RepID=A0A1P8WI26_9PLAN|nr:hypothetical protein [Fuerstiella marisgermanici]APZ93712.1 hypothetical protein Fuma_03330 [Fuerstiella marisgermanici]
MDVPSTHVVPPYDRLARWEWLGWWMLLALIGAMASAIRYELSEVSINPVSLSAVYRFYREQLGANFLTNTHTLGNVAAVKLPDLRPTADGLPYPLILASSMEPVTVNGCYRVHAEPFVFSPLYSGNFDSSIDQGWRTPETSKPTVGPVSSRDVTLPGGATVTLADTITISGAAVTPLMTGNRCLSVLLDFFNTGLGQRVCRKEQSPQPESAQTQTNGTHVPDQRLSERASALLVAASGIAIAIWLLSPGEWTSAIPLLCLAGLVAISLKNKSGSAYLLSSLIRPQARSAKDNGRALEPGDSVYVADGGFTDYLGVTPLLRRRCELIVVSDAGANLGTDPLGTLARMCESAASSMGVRFLDLDHEAPIDFGRLKQDDQRLVHQPYLCMRVRYPEDNTPDGLLFYCQMAITERDPIEIRQIRNRFPSFPDEPTSNQFYTDEQVSAYGSLGHHIASQLCRELERWDFASHDNLPAAVQTPAANTTQNASAHLDTRPAAGGTMTPRCVKVHSFQGRRAADYVARASAY